MNDYIDIYCERLIPGLWAEPLNALSNIAFLVAAIAMWRLAQQRQNMSAGVWSLVILAASIGIGSGLFHTFATTWANILDVLPIVCFQLCFIGLYSGQVIRMRYGYVGALLISFLLISRWSGEFSDILNGSLSYAPAFLVLLGFGLYHYHQQKHEPFGLLVASGVFLLSLSFRTLDQTVCPYLPIGTHFLWHLFNGVLLYLSARALILNQVERGEKILAS